MRASTGNPVLEKFAEREKNWEIPEALLAMVRELGRTPAEVALAWGLRLRPRESGKDSR